MTRARLVLVSAIAAAIVAFFALGLDRYVSISHFQHEREALQASVTAAPAASALAFFALYVAVAALSLPGAAVMTLVAGALFGVARGTLIVSFASSIGATLACLTSRFLLRDAVQRRFGDKLEPIDAGFEKEGPFYLFALRLVPAFPFFVINLVMGLTRMRAWTFYWVSQLGMLPGTIAYVYAGRELGRFELSWRVLMAFAILGVFPLAAKRLLDHLRARKVYSRWTKPRAFERNVVVIGAGSAGLVSAYIAAAVKARVTLVEQGRMGGDCLNTGCVPSKALIRTARVLANVRRASELGVRAAQAEIDFAYAMERVQRVIRAVQPHDSAERYEALGVECLSGKATITSPWTVAVETAAGTRTLTTRAIVIAAGARPVVPPIPGLAEAKPLTSDTVWALRTLPQRLAVLGGGPIGCELAQCFARFGSSVTQVEMMPRLLMREDPDASAIVTERLRATGVNVLLEHRAQRVEQRDGENVLIVERGGRQEAVPFDAILCAVGRVANTENYGLRELGIPISRSGTIETNAKLQTRYANIYACGDVAGPFQFTHTASHQAWYATVNALFAPWRSFKADYRVIPWATFTDPEVARVGLNETEAREKKVEHEVTTFRLEELDRAIVDGAAHGFVKVLTAPGKDRILGATIVGERAADLIVEFALAMRHGIGLAKLLGTLHVYPTFSEAAKYAAGTWRRAHAPQRALRWLERYHAWMRA